MEITKNPELRKQVFDNIRAVVTKERPGIHLSDTNFCSRKAFWRKKGLAPPPTDKQCLLYATGHAFQAWLFPFEMEESLLVDGINCTPDIPSGIEVKSTRQSMRKFDFSDMGHWQRQILGYCKALNKLEYDLVVMFVMGDYAPPFPDMDCWHISASQEEVEANWEEVLMRASRLREALETDTLPEPDNELWEGDYCECVDFCVDTACYRKKQLQKEKREAKGR